MGHDFANSSPGTVRTCATDGTTSCTNNGAVMDYFQVCAQRLNLHTIAAIMCHNDELSSSIS